MATGYPSAPTGRQPGPDGPQIDHANLQQLPLEDYEARAYLGGLDSPAALRAIAVLLLDAAAAPRTPPPRSKAAPRPSTAPPGRPAPPRSSKPSQSSTP